MAQASSLQQEVSGELEAYTPPQRAHGLNRTLARSG